MNELQIQYVLEEQRLRREQRTADEWAAMLALKIGGFALYVLAVCGLVAISL
jgi:hypothetical protein